METQELTGTRNALPSRARLTAVLDGIIVLLMVTILLVMAWPIGGVWLQSRNAPSPAAASAP